MDVVVGGARRGGEEVEAVDGGGVGVGGSEREVEVGRWFMILVKIWLECWARGGLLRQSLGSERRETDCAFPHQSI